jgi:hypothetical protein
MWHTCDSACFQGAVNRFSAAKITFRWRADAWCISKSRAEIKAHMGQATFSMHNSPAKRVHCLVPITKNNVSVKRSSASTTAPAEIENVLSRFCAHNAAENVAQGLKLIECRYLDRIASICDECSTRNCGSRRNLGARGNGINSQSTSLLNYICIIHCWYSWEYFVSLVPISCRAKQSDKNKLRLLC